MPVNAVRLVRKMRGGAQAHLLEADDGHFYVVKFRNNPQHRRVLVNEWIASTFLQYLQVAAPETAIVRLTPEFLAGNPEVSIALGNERRPAEAGWHFGSRYPGDPNRVAVYDFVPDALLDRVENRNEFLGVLVFDKWTGNADARQSIFLRARLREYVPTFQGHALRIGFLALMVDHGYIFNGPHWEYADSPLMGLYFRPKVYSHVRGWDEFQPWLDRVLHFPEEVVDDALAKMPAEWLNGDRDALYSLLDKLMARRRRVPDLIEDCRRASINPFPNWAG
jgi:HipA-like protein